jgi:hypothetical protein
MADIEREIAEDLQRQQLALFWQENGNWIIGGVIGAVLMTAVMTWYRQYTHDHNMRETAQLIEIMNDADVGKLSAYAAKADRNHAALARFDEAALYAKRGDSAKASALYAQIEGTTGLDRVYRDLARLLRISQTIEQEDPGRLHQELEPLKAPKSAWRFTALEMDALVYARQGKLKEAADDLAEIAGDSASPVDERTRATTLRELYIGAANSHR